MRSSVLSRRRFLTLGSGVAATSLLGGFSAPLWADSAGAMPGMADRIQTADNTPGGQTDTSSLRLAEPFKLKLAINQSAICIAPVTVAQQQNLFSKYNLDVEFVNFGNSTDVLLQAIATGKADAGIGMALRWLKALEQGFDVKLTAGTHGGCLSLITANHSPYTSLASLKGKAIGVTDMAGPDKNFFAILLNNHGIDPITEVEWKVYPADLMSQALDKGEIAAISGSEPFSTRLLDTGKYHLLASNMSGEYAHLSCCVIGVSGALVRKHKPAAAALTQALLDAHSFAATNPQKVGTEFMAHALNTTPQEVSAILMSQAHSHHAVGQAFVNEMTQYVTDLQRVQVISASVNPHQFAESIYANVFA